MCRATTQVDVVTIRFVSNYNYFRSGISECLWGDIRCGAIGTIHNNFDSLQAVWKSSLKVNQVAAFRIGKFFYVTDLGSDWS